jgi:hypothetical protein
MAIALGGCSSHSSGYTRTDGVSVDPLHEQSTLAQCKGEGATAIGNQSGPGVSDVFERERRETAIVNGCMARNGYIHAQQ